MLDVYEDDTHNPEHLIHNGGMVEVRLVLRVGVAIVADTRSDDNYN